MDELKVGSRVSYADTYGKRTGTVIEVNGDGSRARIKWDDNRPRTWIRRHALILLPDGAG